MYDLQMSPGMQRRVGHLLRRRLQSSHFSCKILSCVTYKKKPGAIGLEILIKKLM